MPLPQRSGTDCDPWVAGVGRRGILQLDRQVLG